MDIKETPQQPSQKRLKQISLQFYAVIFRQ